MASPYARRAIAAAATGSAGATGRARAMLAGGRRAARVGRVPPRPRPRRPSRRLFLHRPTRSGTSRPAARYMTLASSCSRGPVRRATSRSERPSRDEALGGTEVERRGARGRAPGRHLRGGARRALRSRARSASRRSRSCRAPCGSDARAAGRSRRARGGWRRRRWRSRWRRMPVRGSCGCAPTAGPRYRRAARRCRSRGSCRTARSVRPTRARPSDGRSGRNRPPARPSR